MSTPRTALFISLAALLLVASARAANLPAKGNWFGTLQSTLKNAAALRTAGATLATVELSWEKYQPAANQFSPTYAASIQKQIAAFHAKGLGVVLDLGMQYPPPWTRKLPNAQYLNQYGDTFQSSQPGFNGLNAVFSPAVRQAQARYVTQILKDLGTDFTAIRLGWCYYGELNFPTPTYKEHHNCYWAFDPLAQGTQKGLPDGIQPCPVPAWKPGQTSSNHNSARLFAEWYLANLQNYHDWQISMLRTAGYHGKLAMLYPSWGIRPGQLDAAVNDDLAGTTPAEKNGEIQRGFNFAPFIQSIHDPDLIVYSTWLDSDPKFGDDNAPDESQWSPIHWLASLAQKHKPPLDIWGENTGRGNLAAMQLSFRRAAQYHLLGLMWAFEPDLFSPKYATLQNFAALIRKSQSP